MRQIATNSRTCDKAPVQKAVYVSEMPDGRRRLEHLLAEALHPPTPAVVAQVSELQQQINILVRERDAL